MKFWIGVFVFAALASTVLATPRPSPRPVHAAWNVHVLTGKLHVKKMLA